MRRFQILLRRALLVLKEEGFRGLVKQADRKITYSAIDFIVRYRWPLKPPFRVARKVAKFFLLFVPASLYFAVTGRGFVRFRRGGFGRKVCPDSKNYKVLFVYGFEPVWHAKRYRVDNLQSRLGLFGIKSDSICADEARYRIALQGLGWLGCYSVVVLFRVAADPYFNELAEAARKANIILIYSSDDLIFDPSALRYIDAYRKKPAEERKRYREGVVNCQKLLKQCDYFIASTDSLRKSGEKLGKKSFTIRNGLNDIQLKESQKALMRRKPHPGEVRIGYFSGTATHQKDFAEAAPALLRLLKEYPHLKLYIVGHLYLGRKFRSFEKQIVRYPFIDWKELPYKRALLDILIAPLELNNPFTDAKSELKYFEAALLKVPTVASPTTPYRFAIRNGKNGFLASNTDEWYRCLKTLIEDKELRKKMGEAAYQHTIKTYTPEAQAPQTKKVFGSIARDFLKRGRGTVPSFKISVVIPCLNEEKGIAETIKKIPPFVDEVVVADNGSTDRSVEVAKAAGAKVIVEKRRGYGYALKAGINAAGGDIIITADADATYPVGESQKAVEYLLGNNLDFVSCNRLPLINKESMGTTNVLGTRVLNLVVLVLFGIRLKDILSGMWVFKKSCYKKLILVSNDWNFSEEIKIEAAQKCHFGEYHIAHYARVGETKLLKWRVGVENLIFLFWKRVFPEKSLPRFLRLT